MQPCRSSPSATRHCRRCSMCALILSLSLLRLWSCTLRLVDWMTLTKGLRLIRARRKTYWENLSICCYRLSSNRLRKTSKPKLLFCSRRLWISRTTISIRLCISPAISVILRRQGSWLNWGPKLHQSSFRSDRSKWVKTNLREVCSKTWMMQRLKPPARTSNTWSTVVISLMSDRASLVRHRFTGLSSQRRPKRRWRSSL